MNYPPFKITEYILAFSNEIHETLGELKNLSVVKPSLKLRRENKIKTIHHSLAIEGNQFTERQVTDILENKRVIGPEKQIIEVKNALHVYDQLSELNPIKEKDLLKAHKLLMNTLVSKPGRYRSGQVGIFKGTKVSHIAPPAKQVSQLMGKLFSFLQDNQSSWMIKACIFHYELEFIHPFEDGNGRMGRLWQQLLLMKHSQVFEFISTESLIHEKQKEYYNALEKSDKAGDSTHFIEFSLSVILESLREFKNSHVQLKPKIQDRLEFAMAHFGSQAFTRSDYMKLFPEISTATASRDLAKAVRMNLIKKLGDRAVASYILI